MQRCRFPVPTIFAPDPADQVLPKMSGMSRVARFSKRSIGLLQAFVFLPLLLAPLGSAAAPDDPALYAQGEKIFRGYCTACHRPDRDATGPMLKGSRERWEGQGDIYAWIRNSQAYLRTGNAYANRLFEEWKRSVMTPMPLSDEEIDAVLYFADNYQPPAAAADDVAVGPVATAPTDAGDAWLWALIIGLLLLVVTLSLTGVRRSLSDAVAHAEGREPEPRLGFWGGLRQWAWENKVFASVIGLFVVVYVLVWLWGLAWNIGVYGGEGVENYRPDQPIAFDHTLHAGKAGDGNLAIDCQYCHSSAEKSKHAGIPSTNICMNCHMAVNEGRSEAGTAEIAKIYRAVGWDPDQNRYTGETEPVRWVKVHVLPDHAYFNHAQHVAVAGIDCRECHGPIDEQMTVAEQWSPLTMGWCIDCHGRTAAPMDGNGYYDEVMHRLTSTELGHRELMKYLEDDKITVQELGGWECAKCHY